MRDVRVCAACFNNIAGMLSSILPRVQLTVFVVWMLKVVFAKPQDIVLDSLLFLLPTSELPMTLQNTLLGYADDSTLIAEVQKPGNRALAVSSLNNDFASISDSCKRWGMLVNPNKIEALVISVQEQKRLFPLFQTCC